MGDGKRAARSDRTEGWVTEGTLGWRGSTGIFLTMNLALGIGFGCTEPHSERPPGAWVLAAQGAILVAKVQGMNGCLSLQH